MSIKRICEEVLKSVIRIKTEISLDAIEKKMIKIHPEWDGLKWDERNSIAKKYENAYICYKNITGKWSKYFVPDTLYQTEFLPILNPIDYNNFKYPHRTSFFEDKNYIELTMPNVRFPKSILHRINTVFFDSSYNQINTKDAEQMLKQRVPFFAKKSIGSGHGAGVLRIEREDCIKDFLLSFGNDYVCQEPIEQHTFFSNYNDTSVNVIRITTINWKGEVFVLGAILRVGPPGGVCDLVSHDGHNPRIVGVDSRGHLMSSVVDPVDGTVYKDIFGKKTNDVVPCFDDMRRIAIHNHERFPSYGIIGWDFTVDKDENIICIEYNTFIPGIVQSQYVLGPIFDVRVGESGECLFESLMNEANKH